jgi:SAM-dependent methyltransferase
MVRMQDAGTTILTAAGDPSGVTDGYEADTRADSTGTGLQIWSCRFGCGDGEGVVAEASNEVEASAECLHVAGYRVDGGEFAALDLGDPSGRDAHGQGKLGTGRCGRAHPNGRNPGDVWSIPTRPYRGPHFAAFPVDIPTRCIKAGCKPGGMVLDLFCGTGTTGIAALALGRQFTGIEISPAFAALAAERLRQAAQADPDGGSQ